MESKSASDDGNFGDGKRKKRKFGEHLSISSNGSSPCSKTARSGCYKVFLCGFTGKERCQILRHCKKVEVCEALSTSVTHIIVKPPSKKNRSYLYSALYYAVVSGAYLLQPSWLASCKDEFVPEHDHEFSLEDNGMYTTKFREILMLHRKFRDSHGIKKSYVFSNKVFSRVLLLCGRSRWGKQKKAALHSLITAGGGSIAIDDCWRQIREKPCKAVDLVSLIIIANGEDLYVHNTGVNFIKQLLMLRIPVLYEEIIGLILHNEVIVDHEVMITHSVYYWCNKHFEKLGLSEKEIEHVLTCHRVTDNDREMSPIVNRDPSGKLHSSSEAFRNIPTQLYDSGECSMEEANLLEEIEKEINEKRQGEVENAVLNEDVSEEQLGFVIKSMQDVLNSSTSDDIGLFEIFDLNMGQKFDQIAVTQRKWSDGVSALSHLVPKALARSGVESASLSRDLRQYFDSILMELTHNFPTSFIHDFICLEAVNSIRCSLHPLLLPSPDILSLIFCHIAKPEFGQQFDAGSAVYRLLMFFLYQFPPCNAEGRFYWLQVLTSDSSKSDCSMSDEQSGLYLKGSSLLQRVAAFRAMILETFTGNVGNHNLMELLVSVLEADLFNMEGCGGLDTSQEVFDDDDDEPSRLSHSLSCDERTVLLEESQYSSILDGVPLSLLVFYDPLERRKRGLDKAAMETCFAIVDSAIATNSIISANLCWRLLIVALEGLRFFLCEKMKLFSKQQISVDLQLDIERLGRYLFKNGLTMEDIIQFVRVDWICDTISAIK